MKRLKDETKVLLVILLLCLVVGVLLCSGCFRGREFAGSEKSADALDVVRQGPAGGGSGRYDVDRDAGDGDLDNGRIVLRLDDYQKRQESGRGARDDDNNRSDRDGVSIDVAGVPAVNIFVCPDWGFDWLAGAAVSAGWYKPYPGDKAMVAEETDTDRDGLTRWLFGWLLFAGCCLLIWWVWKNRTTVYETLDVDDDGDIDMDDIKAARDKVLRKGGEDEVT